MKNMMEEFEKFARSKPADEAYNYSDAVNCPCAQFAKAFGMEDDYFAISETDKLKRMLEDPDATYPFTELEIYAATKPHTFGALAERIKERVHDQAGGVFAPEPATAE